MSTLDATSRLDARRRATLRRRRAIVGGLAGALVLGVAAWYVVVFSGLFGVHAVTVTGLDVLTTDEVRQAAAVETGGSLALVDTDAVTRRVAALPAVAQVTVSRSWPTTLRIEVTERQPAMAIPSGSAFLIADATGVVFVTDASAPDSLVRVKADPGNQRAIADAGSAFSALSPKTAKAVRQVEASTPSSITLLLTGGRTVVWGGADQPALKSQVLDALLTHKASVYDVSAPSHPATK